MDELSKYNHSKGYPKNASFRAFTLSIFIHACIIYFFDLSPLSFLCSTKGWFAICNTIIFIVAIDFKSFFSSIKYQNIHEEDVKYGQIHNFSSLDFHDRLCNIAQEKEKCSCECEEKVIHEVVLSKEEIQNTSILQSIIRDENQHSKDMFDDNVSYISFQTCKNEAQNEIGRKEENVEGHVELCNTSEIVVYDKNTMNVAKQELEVTPQHKKGKVQVRQVEEKEDENNENDKEEDKDNENDKEEDEGNGNYKGEEEEDEFSRMSNEEVNRRFEEFINRCNQQIRVQEAQMRRFNLF